MTTIKLKEPCGVRTYDKEGFRKRAACICVNEDETKVLLVTSRKDNSQWIVPGGGVEPDETEEVAALREVKEEAGVNGSLGRCLGLFENTERRHRTSVYVLLVTEEYDEWDEARTFGRQRQWFLLEDAVSILHKPLQSNYVKLLLPPDHLFHTNPPHPHVAPIHPHPHTENCCPQSISSSASIDLKCTESSSTSIGSNISNVPEDVVDKGLSAASSKVVKSLESSPVNVHSTTDLCEADSREDKSTVE